MKKQTKKPAKAKKVTVKKVTAKKTAPVKTKKKPVKKAVAKATKKVTKQPLSKKTIEALIKEMEQEAKTTRKMLERIPEDKYDWRPHPKSMTVQRLATHIAEIPSWVSMTINTDELDFANSNYVPTVVRNNADLIALLEKSLAAGKESLAKANDELLSRTWIMRNGDTIISKLTKGEMIRTAYCQTVHHRAQLGVFLRLLDVPIPGSYGPSADEPNF